jgi:hypothetical protein
MVQAGLREEFALEQQRAKASAPRAASRIGH